MSGSRRTLSRSHALTLEIGARCIGAVSTHGNERHAACRSYHADFGCATARCNGYDQRSCLALAGCHITIDETGLPASSELIPDAPN